MEANYNKLDFGRTINEHGINGFITSSICHNYGSVSGCDERCPALLDGKCECPHDAIKSCDITDEERSNILWMYKNIEEE